MFFREANSSRLKIPAMKRGEMIPPGVIEQKIFLIRGLRYAPYAFTEQGVQCSQACLIAKGRFKLT